MHPSRWPPLPKRFLFVTALLVAASVREGSGLFVDQAVIWFPSGVAVAGLWLLGAREVWTIVIFTFGHRLLIGYDAGVATSAAAGSAAEALLGYLVLRRLGFDAKFGRLRDFVVLLAAAATAPLASALGSWLGRGLLWADPNMPFNSGWGGWWRMNALGVLTVVPPAVTWLSESAERLPARRVASAAAGAAAAAAAVLVLLLVVPVSVTGVLLLTAVLPISLWTGVRFGPRGAASAGALVAAVVAMATVLGVGPFLSVARNERHMALQVFELLLVTVPLVLGALVAERETARVGVAQSEELRASILLALPDVTYRIRRDLVCSGLFVPDEAAVPFSRGEVVGRSLRDLLPEETAGLLERTIAEVLGGRIAVTVDYPMAVDGERCVHEARCVPYGQDEILAVVRDITERRRAEEALRESHESLEKRVAERTASLREANRELEAFSYSVSHELRAPLRAIDGHSALILREHEQRLDEKGRRHFAQLRWNTQRMGRLIDDLLAFSRAGRTGLTASPVDMTGAAREAFVRAVPDKGERSRISFALGELPAIPGDADLLKQVWENLLSNAAKFSAGRERPEVLVDGAVEGGEVVYRVSDNGVGFDMKYVDKLFGVFHRLHGMHEFEGTGVGLALVRRIVVRHGGRVRAEGELGRGATFSFSLPLERPPGAGSA